MDNKQPAISVIVPVYNAEKYLHRCVDSILNQTFTDLEVLLINDGSTDSSGIICDEYVANDSRVRVFHKENEGVSATRQFGLIVALGDYSIQIDSDDWIESDMFEIMHKNAIENNSDIVLCDIVIDVAKDKYKLSSYLPSGNTGDSLYHDLMSARMPGTCVNKLVKHSIYRENNIVFPENIDFGEDWYINVLCALYAKKVSYVPSPFYHYVQNDSSIMHNLSKDDYKNRFKALSKLESEINDRFSISSKHDVYIYMLQLECFYSGKFTIRELSQMKFEYSLDRGNIANFPLRYRLPIKAILQENYIVAYFFFYLKRMYRLIKY